MTGRWFLPFMFGIGCGTLAGQEASVHSQKTEYEGKKIEVTIADNPFLPIPKYSTGITCGEGGEFNLSVPLNKGTVVQFETGIYLAWLYMQPGFHYEVEFPEYREPDFEESISPYYQLQSVPLKVVTRTSTSAGNVVMGRSEINGRIVHFDSLFFIANEQVVLNRRKKVATNVDSLIVQMESRFASDTSLFFSEYRRYRYGVMKLNQGTLGLMSIGREYLGPVVRMSHPGFVELFRAMFRDFLVYYSRTKEGRDLRYFINRIHDLDSVRTVVAKHPAIWNDTIRDMVILQELPGLFYSGTYHKEAILILLDSLIADPVTPDLGLNAHQIKEKLSSLMIGHSPPPFTLTDTRGEEVSTDDFRDKYTYLMFCTPNHYGCMIEYPFLESFREKHGDYLRIITVMVAEEASQVNDFMERNNYNWTALYYDHQTSLLEKYTVRAYPTAYLIGRDGKLILSPAILPSEGFEQQLFRIMRSRNEI